MAKTILVVEDEHTINRMISNYFIKEGYDVLQAYNGQEALTVFAQETVDLICLDIMMPLMNGWDVAMEIRKTSSVPIIMMSALSEEDDILKSYAFKVDDYITKPFNPRVLMAKVSNMIERYAGTTTSSPTRLSKHHLMLDFSKKAIYLKDSPLNLTKKEYDLLRYLMENEGAICSRKLLRDDLWGADVDIDERIVDTYIKKIRHHLGPYSDYIKTVFGVGYRFESYA
jgi:DNA-binding response OmpR family regulator